MWKMNKHKEYIKTVHKYLPIDEVAMIGPVQRKNIMVHSWKLSTSIVGIYTIFFLN